MGILFTFRFLVCKAERTAMKRRILRLGALIGLYLSATLAIAGTSTYEYDAQGRLKKVQFPNGTTTTYTLDAEGNRTQVTTTPDVTAPTQPPSAWFSGTLATSTTANWTSSTDNIALAGYDYRLNAGSWVSVGVVNMTGLMGLTPLTFYNFELRARDLAGNVSAVRSAGFTTPEGTPPTAPPSAWFSGTTATSTTANWTSSTDNVGVTGYDYRLNGGSWSSVGVTNMSGLTGLTSHTFYNFEIRARDAAGNVSAITSAGFTTP